jgi:hypothetical protein
MNLISNKLRGHFTPVPARLEIGTGLLAAILAIETCALFALRLAGKLQFNAFAFFDTGANLTVQYLIDHGYRPTIDFAYHYGLLPLWLGRLWFGLLGLSPFACIALVPIFDLLIAWGFVRLAANLRLNLAGILIILLTASLTIPPSLLNITHCIEPILLLQALAAQASGNRREALAFAAASVFVKPSMAYFLGLVLIVFILIDWQRSRGRQMRELVKEICQAMIATGSIAIVLVASFGMVPVIHSLLPIEGRAMYRAQGFGFFGPAGRSFLAPRSAPWTYYGVNVAGPWIAYTAVLVVAACFAARTILTNLDTDRRIDSTSEMILTCALLHLSFILFFFGNEFSWSYYFYIPVIGLAAAARLGTPWEFLVVLLALAVPLTKLDKRIIQHRTLTDHQASVYTRDPEATMPTAAALPAESGFTYQLWFTTAPSPVTAGLWATSAERTEWVKVLATIRGRQAAMLEYYGCADLLFPEFSPPVTLYLVPGAVTEADLSRKLAQLQASTMIVMPRWHSGLLDDIPAIGALVRRDFVPAFHGAWFIVYVRRKTRDFLRLTPE